MPYALSFSTNPLSKRILCLKMCYIHMELSNSETGTISATDSIPSFQPITSVNLDYDPARAEEDIGRVAEKSSASKIFSLPYIVDSDGPDDQYRPTNWPLKKKIFATLLYGLTTTGSTWASSVYSVTTAQVAQEFGVSNLVSTLGLTLFLFGYAFNHINPTMENTLLVY